MEEGIAHDNGIQKRVQLLNAATERHRLEGYYRLGQVPAHIVHPLVRSLVKVPSRRREPSSDSQSSSLMEVDEEEALDVADPRTGLVIEMGSRSKATGVAYEDGMQTTTRKKHKLPGFSDEELLVNKAGSEGAENRIKYPEAVASRNAKVTERNVVVRKGWAATDAKKLAAATKKVGVAARKTARDFLKRSA